MSIRKQNRRRNKRDYSMNGYYDGEAPSIPWSHFKKGLRRMFKPWTAPQADQETGGEG